MVENKKVNEILLIAQEECAEVTQAISKCFRFGFKSKHPNENRNNKERLEEELGDLVCMIGLMIEEKIIDSDNVEKAAQEKLAKLKKWSNIYN